MPVHGRENTNVLAQNFVLYLHMRIMFDITFLMYKYVYSQAVRSVHTCLGLWDVLVYTHCFSNKFQKSSNYRHIWLFPSPLALFCILYMNIVQHIIYVVQTSSIYITLQYNNDKTI